MIRRFQNVFALAMVLCTGAFARAQTDKSVKILFENLSRETIVIDELETLSPDNTRKTWTGPWVLKSGDRSYLGAANQTVVEGRQVFYTIGAMDGAREAGWRSLAKVPVVLDTDVILQTLGDDEIATIRSKDTTRKLTKAERTYRYWNAVHGICLEENFDAIQNVGFLEISKATGYIRAMATRIEDLDATEVDADAVAAAKSLSSLYRELVKVLNGRNGGQAVVVLSELYQLKADKLGKMLDENQVIAGSSENLFEFIRSRRKALEKRYAVTYPHLIPPVQIVLTEFNFKKGYWVHVCNSSGDDIKDVRIRYRDAFGKNAIQSVTKRMTFSPTASFTEVDPDKVPWRVASGEWITILYEGGAYSYPTAKLIKRK